MKFDFLRIESFKTGILFSSAFSFLSKLLLFFQSVVIAYYFGTGTQTDVYFYCFTTITLLSVFVNSLDTSVLIPESMRLAEQVGKSESIKFLNFFIYIYFSIGLLVTGLIYISPINVFLTLSNFNLESLIENREILLLCIPLFTLMIATNLLVNILTSYKFFTIPMIIGLTNGIVVLLSVFLLHNNFDLLSILIGQLSAYVLNISFLVFLMKKKLNWVFSIEIIKLRKGLLKNMGFAQAGNITSVLSSYIPIYLLSGFNPGIITALIYGQKTAEMPTQLITNQASSIVGIKLNELVAQKNHLGLNRIFLDSTRVLLFMMTPISFMMFLYGEEIITILFQRGAFDVTSVQSSVEFFRYFVFLLPMLVFNTMVSRLFMADQKIKQSFYYQVAFNSLLIVFIYLGIEKFGIVGYPIALISMHIFNVLAYYWLLRILFSEIKYLLLVKMFLKIVGVNIIISVVIYYIKDLILYGNDFMSILIGSSIYLMALLVINWILDLNHEINYMLRKIIFSYKFK